MKNTFDSDDRKHRLVLMLLTHRQNRLDKYSDSRWNAIKMLRYRWKKRLWDAPVEDLDFNKLKSRCLYVHPTDPARFRLIPVKGRDMNLEVTRLMKQLLGGRKYVHGKG